MARATLAEAPSLQASADHAAELATSGQPVIVAGSSRPGIARQLFTQFAGGKYSWPILSLAITEGSRPAEVLVADERDQAIKDITQERTNQARQLADLQWKQAAQTDAAKQALFDPTIQRSSGSSPSPPRPTRSSMVCPRLSQLPSRLSALSPAPLRRTAAQKPLIESALKPDQPTTPTGAAIPFAESLPGDPKSYTDKLRAAAPTIFDDAYQRLAEKRGKAEHADPAKARPLSEFERIGNASKRETDKVFGQYKTTPPLKADTATVRGNIHDRFAEVEAKLAGLSPAQRREMARQLIFWFFQNRPQIAEINRLHNADPKFTPDCAATNPEATDQQQVATDLTATPDQVKRLNEIDRGWPATASPGTGSVSIQTFKAPDEASGPPQGPASLTVRSCGKGSSICSRVSAHSGGPAYRAFADSFGTTSNQWSTLIEGVDTLLDEVVWSSVAPHVNDQALRNDVEGPAYAAQPPINVPPASHHRCPSYTQAVKLVSIVGIRNLYAAYFLGDVQKIKDVPRWVSLSRICSSRSPAVTCAAGKGSPMI